MLRIVIGYFVVVGIWIAYELIKTPNPKYNSNKIKKNVKGDNLIEFDKDEEFLG